MATATCRRFFGLIEGSHGWERITPVMDVRDEINPGFTQLRVGVRCSTCGKSRLQQAWGTYSVVWTRSRAGGSVAYRCSADEARKVFDEAVAAAEAASLEIAE